MSRIGDEIKRRREEQHISQNQLAKRAGMSQSALSSIERTTKSPNTETVSMLAEALNCTVADILGEKEKETDAKSISPKAQKVLAVFDDLSPSSQDEILNYVLWKKQLEQNR